MEITDIALKWDKTRIMIVYDQLPTKKIDLMRLSLWTSSCKDGDWIGTVKWGASMKASTSWINLEFPCGTTLYVKWGYQAKKKRIWLEFNPTKATPEGMYWIKFHIHQLFDNGVETLINFGVVTHGEFAIDIIGAIYNDYWFFDESAKTGDKTWLDDGTFAIGSKKSDRRLKCYDKAKELLEKFNLFVPAMLRLEALLQKKKKFSLNQFSSLANPFTMLIVVPRVAMAASQHSLIKKLVSKMKKLKRDSQQIYQHFPTNERKMLTQALRKLQPSWWKPQEIWKLLPGATLWIARLLEFDSSIV